MVMSEGLCSEVTGFLSLMADNEIPLTTDGLQAEDALRRAERIAEICAGNVEFPGKVKEFRVPSPNREEGIPISVYIPKWMEAKPAIVVYFHGTGLIWGTRRCLDSMCKTLSKRSKTIFITVDYRNLPDHKFPAALDDAICTLRWVMFNKPLLGGRNDSNVGVAGDSGGGLLAATLCHEIKTIQFQILIYPKLGTKTDLKSYKEYSDGPIINNQEINRCFAEWLPENSDPDNVKWNPLNRATFEKLPPAQFVLAECDPIKDDAHEYMKKLKKAGVKTHIVMVKGACHSFFHLPGHFKSCSQKAYDRVLDFLNTNSGYNISLLT